MALTASTRRPSLRYRLDRGPQALVHVGSAIARPQNGAKIEIPIMISYESGRNEDGFGVIRWNIPVYDKGGCTCDASYRGMALGGRS